MKFVPEQATSPLRPPSVRILSALIEHSGCNNYHWLSIESRAFKSINVVCVSHDGIKGCLVTLHYFRHVFTNILHSFSCTSSFRYKQLLQHSVESVKTFWGSDWVQLDICRHLKPQRTIRKAACRLTKNDSLLWRNTTHKSLAQVEENDDWIPCCIEPWPPGDYAELPPSWLFQMLPEAEQLRWNQSAFQKEHLTANDSVNK